MISMNKLALILVASTLILGGCDFLTNLDDKKYYGDNESLTGSGNLIAITKTFTDFESIEASHAFKITLVQSDEFDIQLEIDDNLIDYLIAEKEGNKLRLSLLDNNSYNNITLRARISMPDIYFVEMSGACTIHFPELILDHSLVMDLSGASKVTGSLTAGNLEFNLSGASYMDLTGTGNDMMIYGSGASRIEFGNFVVNDAEIHLSGASLSTLNATGILSAYLSGASILYYKGNPTIGVIQTSGESYVEHI